jgi:hypothetical protein
MSHRNDDYYYSIHEILGNWYDDRYNTNRNISTCTADPFRVMTSTRSYFGALHHTGYRRGGKTFEHHPSRRFIPLLNTGEKFSKDKEPTPESKRGFAFVQEFCRSLRGRQEEGLFFSIHMCGLVRREHVAAEPCPVWLSGSMI